MLRTQSSKNNFNNKAKVSYKTLFDMLKRNGVQQIEMPLIDMLPFTLYLTKNKYKEKIYISTLNGKAIFSTKPLVQKINITEEKQYQNLINQ